MKIFLISSVSVWLAAFVLAGVLAQLKYKSNRIITSRKAIFVGTFLSSALIYAPIYYEKFDGDICLRALKTVLMSVNHAMRMFLADADFDMVSNYVSGAEGYVAPLYTAFAGLMMVVTPIFTFEFALSLFNNISSYRRYWRKFFRNVYIFSELNEKSLALAKNISGKGKRDAIIFTDVFEQNEECSFELAEQAREVGAICFKKDVLSVNFRFLHSPGSTISFFTTGINESENVNHAFGIIEKYKNRKNTMLYVFSTAVDGGLIMDSAEKGEIKVRRINDVRSLIYRTLYDTARCVIDEDKKGVPEESRTRDIFMNTKSTEDGNKRIGAVVVGCGKHGKEMTKALAWFCQMDGYRVSIDIFDRDPGMESKFTALCPELMSPEYNGVYVDGEAQYLIKFHTDEKGGGLDVDSFEFASEIKKLTDTTYVFVSLGTDDDNIKTAVALRALFEQMKLEPRPTIQAVVYSTEKKDALKNINVKGKKYNIDFVGDLDTLYSEEYIIDSELENDARIAHIKYSDSYFYSSMAEEISGLTSGEKKNLKVEEKSKRLKTAYGEWAKGILGSTGDEELKSMAQEVIDISGSLEQAIELDKAAAEQAKTENVKYIEYKKAEGMLYEAAERLYRQSRTAELRSLIKERFEHYKSGKKPFAGAERVKKLSEEERTVFAKYEEAIEDGEKKFWYEEYNLRSSMATALHAKARIACNIPGADLSEEEQTPEQKKIIGALEHRRWNAYMRSEGYIYDPDRNDLGRMHNDLVNYAKLDDKEKRKDIRVGSK